jgi:hypothetical protein
LIVGTLATSIGVPAWLSMLFSIGVLVLIIRIFGKKVEVYSLK